MGIFEHHHLTRGIEDTCIKSEVAAFVVNAGMNITAIKFYIEIKDRSFFVWSTWYLLCSTEVQLNIYKEYVSLIQVIDGEYIVKIQEVSLNMSISSYCLDFWRLDIKSLS